MAGANVVQTGSGQPAMDAVRQQLNLLVADVNYQILNCLSGNALPAVAVATVTSQAKTVNSVNYFANGVPVTKGATDNLWTFVGVVVAVSSWNKYLLCLNAAGTASVVPGIQSTVSAAAVQFFALPAAGVAIIAVATVATDVSHTFTPGTTLLGAAGITTTFADGVDPSTLLAAKVTLQ